MNVQNKNTEIINAMEKIECQPIDLEEEYLVEYSSFPTSQLVSLGSSCSGIVSTLNNIVSQGKLNNGGERLYRMIIPRKGRYGIVNSIGNIVDSKGKIIARARFKEVKNASTMIANINPTTMLIAIAINCITKK